MHFNILQKVLQRYNLLAKAKYNVSIYLRFCNIANEYLYYREGEVLLTYNIINQKVACKLLDRLGYETIVAENGQQALEQLAATQQQITLILMDCRMPIMDGMEATRTIRAQGDDIPIVALTANDSVEDREACSKAGMDEFLTKPINKNQLIDVLQRIINN